MEHPVKVAPCPLFFAWNGGRFSSTGMPVFRAQAFRADDLDGEGGDDITAAVLCDVAYDCGTCPLLYQWVQGEMAQGWSVGWECTKCLSTSRIYERDNPEVERRLAGFYQAGRDPGLSPMDEDFDQDKPRLTGCTSCGWGSSFLQLVLRRQRR